MSQRFLARSQTGVKKLYSRTGNFRLRPNRAGMAWRGLRSGARRHTSRIRSEFRSQYVADRVKPDALADRPAGWEFDDRAAHAVRMRVFGRAVVDHEVGSRP